MNEYETNWSDPKGEGSEQSSRTQGFDQTIPAAAVPGSPAPGGSAPPAPGPQPGGPTDPSPGPSGAPWPPYPQHPGYPGQPTWGPPAPPPGPGGGRMLVGVLVVLALMVGAAVAGGFVGAWANQELQADGSTGTTVVLDGPQLDRSSLASVASQIQPSVVSISTEGGEGSGVIMSADGFILTNAHVVETAMAGQARVRFNDGQISNARVIGLDQRSDLAVLQAR